MAESYDVVVVGGGHNGLACAGYLAKAGKRVLVLEARYVAGGGCATEEVAAPGFRHNFHSNFHGIIHMGPVYRDLELERYGARYVLPENQFAHVFPDGRAIVWQPERRANGREHRARSRRRTPRRCASSLTLPRRARAGLHPGDVLAAGAALGRTRPARGDARRGSELPGSSSRRRTTWRASLFESPEVQTWIGFWVAQLAGTGDVFGLGANYPVMLAGSTEPYGWGICVGGS